MNSLIDFTLREGGQLLSTTTFTLEWVKAIGPFAAPILVGLFTLWATLLSAQKSREDSISIMQQSERDIKAQLKHDWNVRKAERIAKVIEGVSQNLSEFYKIHTDAATTIKVAFKYIPEVDRSLLSEFNAEKASAAVSILHKIYGSLYLIDSGSERDDDEISKITRTATELSRFITDFTTYYVHGNEVDTPLNESRLDELTTQFASDYEALSFKLRRIYTASYSSS